VTPRERLIEAGLRLLEQDGPEGLQARKLAAEIGASTMAVYTHFGGMPGLYEALVREAFVQFGGRLGEVERTDDPIADLLALGFAYRDHALAHPQRYRLMFGVSAPGTGAKFGQGLTTHGAGTGLAEADATFEQLVELVQRSMAAGRIREDDVASAAGQVWSVIHGYVLLELAGVFGPDGDGVFQIYAPLAINLLVGLGDDRDETVRSARAAVQTQPPV